MPCRSTFCHSTTPFCQEGPVLSSAYRASTLRALQKLTIFPNDVSTESLVQYQWSVHAASGSTNLYPSPRTVTTWRGCPGSGSILARRREINVWSAASVTPPFILSYCWR